MLTDFRFAASAVSTTFPPKACPQECFSGLQALVPSPAKQMEFTEGAISCQSTFLHLRDFPSLALLATLQKGKIQGRQ
jgi:hypothetical protein